MQKVRYLADFMLVFVSLSVLKVLFLDFFRPY